MTTCGDAAARTASSIATVRETIIFDRRSRNSYANRARSPLGTPARNCSTRRRASSGNSASAVGSAKAPTLVLPCAMARAMHTITAV